MWSDYRYFNYIISWLKARGLPVDKSQKSKLEQALEQKLAEATDEQVKDGLRLCLSVLRGEPNNAHTKAGQNSLNAAMLRLEEGFFVSPHFKKHWGAICGVRTRKSAPCVMAKLVADTVPVVAEPRESGFRLVQMEETLEDKVRTLTAEVQELKRCLALTSEVQELNTTLKSLHEEMKQLKGPSWQDMEFMENRIHEEIQYYQLQAKKDFTTCMKKMEEVRKRTEPVSLFEGWSLPPGRHVLPASMSLADCISSVP